MQNTIANRLLAIFAVLMAGAMVMLVVSPSADASHEPAQKVAAAGSDIENVTDDSVVLSETVRVSSTQDMVLQLAAECSILTELTTNNDTPDSSAFGSVRMRLEIDGIPVAVATDDTTTSGEDDEADNTTDDGSEIGEVTFCDRAYSRSVTDDESPEDGIDEEHDFIATRTANAFNWLATDIGFNYDQPENGNNIVLIEVIADYDTTTSGDAVADAYVGSRTLIAEPTNASVHEAVAPEGGAGN